MVDRSIDWLVGWLVDWNEQFSLDLHAIDRFHKIIANKTFESKEGKIDLLMSEFDSIKGLCDAIIVLRVHEPGSSEHFNVRMAPNVHEEAISFTTRATTQFLLELCKRVRPRPIASSSLSSMMMSND